MNDGEDRGDADDLRAEPPTIIGRAIPTATESHPQLTALDAEQTVRATREALSVEVPPAPRRKRRKPSAREPSRPAVRPGSPEGPRRPMVLEGLEAPPQARRSLFRRLLATMLAILAIYGGLTLLLAWQLGATVLQDVFLEEVAPAQLPPLQDAVGAVLATNPTAAEVQEFLLRRYSRVHRSSVAVYGADGVLIAEHRGSPGRAPSTLEPALMAELAEAPIVRARGLGFVSLGPVRSGSLLEESTGPIVGYIRLVALPATGRARDLIVSVSWRWSFPVFLLSALAAFLGTRSITQRLREAEKAVRRIAAGDHDARIEVDTTKPLDEVGRLSLAFNRTVDQLESSVKELEATAKTRRRLVADFAHELNTPLTNVLAYLETLMIGENEGGMRPEDRKGFLSIAHDEARRLAHLAKDLETLTKLESGVVHMDRQLVDLSRLAVGLAQRIETRAEQKGLEVRSDIEAGGQIVGDPMRLEQVGMNLLENAMRYTNEGWIQIAVRTQDDGVELEVADSGVGIPAADIERVMERFYRVDPSRNRATGGSGLGLSIAGHIVQRHGGQIRIVSELGAGSRFIVFFPREGSILQDTAPD